VGIVSAKRDSASVMVYMNRTVTDKSRQPLYDGSRLRELPFAATRSLEVDILPITDDNNQTIELADPLVSRQRGPVRSKTLRVPGKRPQLRGCLITDNVVDPTLIADRIRTVPARYSSNVERAIAWLTYRSHPGNHTT
jgi:hypothetical protein